MSGNGTDWSVLDVAGVRDVVRQAARRIQRRYSDVVELDDLTQEAQILVVTKDPLRECCTEENLGLLQYRLEQRLVDLVRPMASRANVTVSYDKLQEDNENGEGFILPYVQIETASNEYSRESVESLLPAVWDESFTYGMPQRDDAPDPDMPKGSSNKATGNNLSAYIADIKVGWEKAALTQKERAALLLAFGFGWKQEDIAFNQGVSQQAISGRIYSGVGKIVARLNGGFWHELLGVEA